MKKINVKNKTVYGYEAKTIIHHDDTFLSEAEIYDRIGAAMNLVNTLNKSIESMKNILKDFEKEKGNE